MRNVRKHITNKNAKLVNGYIIIPIKTSFVGDADFLHG